MMTHKKEHKKEKVKESVTGKGRERERVREKGEEGRRQVTSRWREKYRYIDRWRVAVVRPGEWQADGQNDTSRKSNSKRATRCVVSRRIGSRRFSDWLCISSQTTQSHLIGTRQAVFSPIFKWIATTGELTVLVFTKSEDRREADGRGLDEWMSGRARWLRSTPEISEIRRTGH